MEEKKQISKEGNTSGKKMEKPTWDIKQYLTVALLVFVVFSLCIMVFFLFYRLDVVRGWWNKIIGVLQPVIFGAVIAYLINPIMNFIERHLDKALQKRMKNEKKRAKLTRVVGTAGALVAFLLIIFILFQMLVPQLVTSISGMLANLPQQVDSLTKWVDETLSGNPELAGMAEEGIWSVTDFLSNWFQTSVLPDLRTYVTEITSGLISIVKILLNLIVGLAIAVYLLYSKEKFIGQSKKIVYAALPVRQANVLVEVVRKAHQIFGGFISGKILDSAIIGVLCYIVLSIMQMPYTLLVSAIVGVTNVIPFFGPFIGAIPSAIIIMLVNPIQGLYFLIFIIILQQLDGNVIGPTILGDSTGLSPFWVIFAILIGGGLYGFAGMILGVPTVAFIYYIVGRAVGYILRKRKLPESTDIYTVAESVDVKTGQVKIKQKKPEVKKEEEKQE